MTKNYARGERHGGAKLTEANVREIRQLYAAGKYSQEKLAAKFGVSPFAINNIVHRRAWRHI
jgi:DNA-binding XRE family transcriptional regulator